MPMTAQSTPLLKVPLKATCEGSATVRSCIATLATLPPLPAETSASSIYAASGLWVRFRIAIAPKILEAPPIVLISK